MKKNYLFLMPIIVVLLALSAPVLAQSDLGIPNVQAIYGGRINAITGYQLDATHSRIYVTTESVNTGFYADLFTDPTGTPVISAFTKIPSMDDTQGFGSSVSKIAAHKTSGYLYFVTNNNLYSTDPSLTTAIEAVTGGVNNVFIKGDNIFVEQSGQLVFGTLDASNIFTPSATPPLALPSAITNASYVINPVSGKIFVFVKGTSPTLYESSEAYNALTASSTFSAVTTTLTSPSVSWNAFGIAPDGRFVIGGSDNATKFIAYSDDGGTSYTEFDTTVSGVSGPNIDFSGDASAYYVYFSTIFSNNRGDTGTWGTFGLASYYTHPNDGYVFADPNNVKMVYMTTDQGLGVSLDNGLNIVSADEGIEAVNVNDMEMSTDKNTAWIASKSGVRKATTYQTTPTWTNAMFPNNDGAPYHSVGMLDSDTKTCYVGNVRVYKTTDSGTNWTRVFTPESSPYSYSGNTKVNAITVCPYDETIVFAGFEITGTEKGGLFYSLDSGATWNQQLLFGSTVNDVDVNDIVFNQEGTDIVAYVGVDYDSSTPTGSSIYKLVQNGTSWTVTQDMDASTTSTGSAITVAINDISLDSATNTLYAVGTDPAVTSNQVVVYSKAVAGDGLWTPFDMTGFIVTTNEVGRAITNSTTHLFVGVDNKVYYFKSGDTSWNSYAYPNGTIINFLLYDALMVGTGTGIYAQSDPTTGTAGIDEFYNNKYGSLNLYPNPVQKEENLNVTYNLKRAGEAQIVVYDIRGRQILKTPSKFQNEGTYKVSLQANKFKIGLYFLTLKLNNSVVLSKKILVK
ncbi:MAG: T9SS type A sorting domain-containing protein [Flavobacteriaceae bacterium]|nr:T9SS type A sorting domain-containing protein [Flavobacteriaceae bacterium]